LADAVGPAVAAAQLAAFSPSVTKVVFEMACAPGAEPWMGGFGRKTKGFLLFFRRQSAPP
jgi:hypothetical protein